MTLQQAQAQLDAWLAASLAVASGKDHSIGDHRIGLESGAEIRAQIAFWTSRVNQLTAIAAGASPGSGRYSVADFSEE